MPFLGKTIGPTGVKFCTFKFVRIVNVRVRTISHGQDMAPIQASAKNLLKRFFKESIKHPLRNELSDVIRSRNAARY